MARKSGSFTVSTLMVAASLFVGGACGSLVRLALSALQPADVTWPWMTTTINLTGAFLLGFITAYMAALGPDIGVWRVTRLGLGTGLIGGYTTYSTFMLEVAKRIKSGEAAIAVAYLLVSILVGLLCAMLGLAVGKAVGKRRARRDGLELDAAESQGNRGNGSDGLNGQAEASISSVSAASQDSAGLVDTDESGESVNPVKPDKSADFAEPAEPIDSIDSIDSTEPNRGRLVGVTFLLFACVAAAALLLNPHWWQDIIALGLLLVASLLGGLGAFARYGVDAWVNNHIHLPFPCGTIAVNFTACLAMGLVAGWCATHVGLTTLQYLLASGFLGGYSTFSTASVEGAKLANGGKPLWAFVHTAGMMVISLALLMLGMMV
ncbi:CrcB family protein [Bifidobacterium sp. ESL0769]|uniref:fluoride efflux transporter FluC n=1 Tax=Bifidobacterium sp. ESL0769 TaxID=2983229 RepID=UPI0023F7AFDD|nr:CrcB family protein [Bifidobacterium sp. ESL0769]WEV66986.1 CrcB family protein [Bifidobacterium sp. ESL0769]